LQQAAAAYRDKMLDRIRSENMSRMPVLMIASKNGVLARSEADATEQLEGEMALFDIIVVKNTRALFFVLNTAGHFMEREHPKESNTGLVTWIDYWNNNPLQPQAGNFNRPNFVPKRAPAVV
jgi:hypothetical protein